MSEQRNLLSHLGEAIDNYRAERQCYVEKEPAPRLHHRGRVLHWFIPNGGTLLLIALLIATQSIWAQPFAATNAPGPSATTVNYQGRMADNLGTPLNGSYGMSFALYDTASAGNLVWGPEVHDAVMVSDGLFSVGLGSRTTGGIPTTTWNGDRYLEITVGGETLSPRELIRSVPIAGMALTVPDGAIGMNQIAAGAIGAAQIADGAVGTGQIMEGAVTFETLAPTAVGKWIIPDNPSTIANQSGASFNWQVVDLSASVPAMAEIVYLKLFIRETGGNGWCSVRPYGSTSAAGIETRTPVANQYGSGTAMIALNDAKIEWKCTSGATISDAGVELWGYFESGY